jgi:prepilin-type N-terminal cleavage/methylation domain-containing protein
MVISEWWQRKNGSCAVKVKHKSQQGFTLLESLVVIGIMGVLMAIAIMGSRNPMQTYRANAALDVVSSQLRVAREIAITQRRWVQISINQVNNTVSYQVKAPNAIGTTELDGPIITMPLPQQTSFMLEAGVPDTPMGFGNTSAVLINNLNGGPVGMAFTPTGAFTDNTYVNPINGTIFVGMVNQPTTARAVTILGSTGRVRPYTYLGNSNWVE